MSQNSAIKFLLDVAQQTISEAGCASMITLDERGDPSSRAVAPFAPDPEFSQIIVGTHPDSRKTVHVRNNGRVALSYVDMTNRGYVTVIGSAHVSDDAEDKKAHWTDRFAAFWPDGPDSDEYQLIVVVPQRLEIRSFGLKVAEVPTRWSPVILERGESNEWRERH